MSRYRDPQLQVGENYGTCILTILIKTCFSSEFNPLAPFFQFYINYHLLNMLKIKFDINQQDLKIGDLHFDKSE